MATETTVKLVDDIDGSEAVETVRFGLDGRDYEIDLCAVNAKELRESLAGFIESGRRAGKQTVRRVTAERRVAEQRGPARADKEQLRAIREWALANGFPVKGRGRIPARVVEAYHASV